MFKYFVLTISVFLFVACICKELDHDDYEIANFKVEGKNAYMSGVIDGKIKTTLEKMLEDNPQVETIVMLEVDGSVDDEANLQAARIVRERGLNTYIKSDGLIASGGTDFFLAGVKRTVEDGAKIGVHSWGDDEIGEGKDVPKNDPVHKEYLDYYKDMKIPSEFYWYTLEVASAKDIHWMTKEEQIKYKISNP